MNRAGDPREEALERYLAQLPSAHPDAGVGDAVIARHLRRRRLRRVLPPVAAAATLLLWVGMHGPDPVTPAAPVLAIDPDVAEMRSIDRRLQAAYLEGATADELAALWAERGRIAQAGIHADAGIRRVRL